MKVVFYQNMPSHHMAGAIRSLAATWPSEVQGVYDTRMKPERKSLGWMVPDMGAVTQTFLDESQDPGRTVQEMIERSPGAIHVLSGFRGCESVRLAWRVLRDRPEAKLASIAERPYYRSWQRLAQQLWYRTFFRLHGQRFRAVFAMSLLGVEGLAQLGLPRRVLFPYMYQTDTDELPPLPEPEATPSRPVRFVYVGRFARCKGADILCRAAEELPEDGSWQMDWIGTGGEVAGEVHELAARRSEVRCLGIRPSDEIIQTLSPYDVCIVPSRYDGWGMAGTEACMAGLGCIVSDAAGCSDLARFSGAGQIVAAGEVGALRDALLGTVRSSSQVLEWKRRARAYRPLLAPQRVGRYLQDVLEYAFGGQPAVRPQAPWLKRLRR